ncbi:helix-turn-helix domain-containing protein [Ammoniphilus resinae]|uniref:Excisionase family DNA binding protein n=1 Tax=Ammoniphilus resinae TaxID=861532 RepID=A0ABS4GXV8_9BACL|nr:helix-turn-helix domain-containing protein [Ammoniphilus resinae]MBP1934867.1 excisionase family DNA binding protein [Ammoniphilus resinae]
MKLFSPEEAADTLGVSPKTIREWLRKGNLPGVKTGRLWRIREEDLQSFTQPQTTKIKEIEFDWDTLEKLTSKAFVDHIRWVIDEDKKNGVIHKNIKLKEKHGARAYEVYVISDIVSIFKFDKLSDSYFFVAFNQQDLEDMISWIR